MKEWGGTSSRDPIVIVVRQKVARHPQLGAQLTFFLRRASTRLVALICLATAGWVFVPPAEATSTCAPSAGATLCLAAPDGPLTGEVTVSVTWAGTGSYTVEFTLDGAYLNYEYQKPYSFTWPTNKELDGTHSLAARVHKGATYGAWVTVSVDLLNGNLTSVPRSPADYEALFAPQPGGVIAAVGNGGAEKPAEIKLLDYIRSTNPAVFGYLGEVHEFGTWATRRDHYGLASFDDLTGQGTLWGQMAGYTLATPGNHERYYIAEYEDYWHHRPLWSTEVIDGIRVYDLTSECNHNGGGCGPTGAQARWLSTQLASNTEPCVLSMWHRPVVSMDTKRSGPTMNTAWSMLANNGGDLVLNADTRDMEEVAPMNASLQADQPDSHMVELISGAAAARWVTSVTSTTTNPRVLWRLYQTPGAVFVQRTNDGTGDRLSWQFRSSTGEVLRSGSLGC